MCGCVFACNLLAAQATISPRASRQPVTGLLLQTDASQCEASDKPIGKTHGLAALPCLGWPHEQPRERYPATLASFLGESAALARGRWLTPMRAPPLPCDPCLRCSTCSRPSSRGARRTRRRWKSGDRRCGSRSAHRRLAVLLCVAHAWRPRRLASVASGPGAAFALRGTHSDFRSGDAQVEEARQKQAQARLDQEQAFAGWLTARRWHWHQHRHRHQHQHQHQHQHRYQHPATATPTRGGVRARLDAPQAPPDYEPNDW